MDTLEHKLKIGFFNKDCIRKNIQKNLIALLPIFVLCSYFFITLSCSAPLISEKDFCQSENKTLPSNVIYSNQFRLFWNDLQIDLGKTPIEKYIPSKTIIQKYCFLCSEKEYCISGFLHVNKDFTPDNVKEIHGTLKRYSSKIYTFQIPIRNVFDLLSIKGLIRIELGAKAYLK